jgi:hypothetical protein
VQGDQQLAELVENVGVTIKYFNSRVEAARAKDASWDWSVQKVLAVIKGVCTRSLRPLPQGLFLF